MKDHPGVDVANGKSLEEQEGFMERQERDLAARIPVVLKERREQGLEGLVGGLDAVIISTEQDRLDQAVAGLLRYTGLSVRAQFEDDTFRTFVLGTEGSANFLVRARKRGENPFLAVNVAEKTLALPNTRLETFIYRTGDLERYVEIQNERGVRFLTPGIIDHPHFRYIQTVPSPYTGNSTGFIEWSGEEGNYVPVSPRFHPANPEKPGYPHLSCIHELDHTATRVRAMERNDAILEFMSLTSYRFDFTVFVKSLNSITSVARLKHEGYAQVFTSGIEPYRDAQTAGPTELFIRHYGTRVHHMAFRTEEIEETVSALRNDGMDFLVELVGSPEEGLHQTFSMPSPHTLLVNEYIHRYEGFDGFFTRCNVEMLTKATERQ
jgi:4-hydroxyphenylpyruvate dioxygenase-like putative hemolysin